MNMKELQNIANAVVAGKIGETKESVRIAGDAGIAAMQIINNGLAAGLQIVGERFKAGELFLAEMMLSATAAKVGIDLATQNLDKSEYQPRATIVLGTIKGDLHDIGKNLVALVLRSSGFEVIDLGVDVHEDEFVRAITTHKPEFLGMSCLMTTTMQNMRDSMDAVSEAGLRDNVKVVVGGCPVSQDFASQIGADGYVRNAGEAIDLMERLLTVKKTNTTLRT
jgi:5-methyltetrahydrofolate--homocysteine methyltransferase